MKPFCNCPCPDPGKKPVEHAPDCYARYAISTRPCVFCKAEAGSPCIADGGTWIMPGIHSDRSHQPPSKPLLAEDDWVKNDERGTAVFVCGGCGFRQSYRGSGAGVALYEECELCRSRWDRFNAAVYLDSGSGLKTAVFLGVRRYLDG